MLGHVSSGSPEYWGAPERLAINFSLTDQVGVGWGVGGGAHKTRMAGSW